MRPFNHVLTLVAFVFAVALTQLLTRVGALLVARQQVRFFGLTALSTLLAILLIFENWLSVWELREQVQWQLPTIGSLFLFAVSVYFVSVFATPTAGTHMDTDLEHFYWSHRVPFFVAYLACEILAIVCNMQFSGIAYGPKMVGENIASIAMIPPIVLAIAVRKQWAQWTGGLLLLAGNLYFLLVFDASLT